MRRVGVQASGASPHREGVSVARAVYQVHTRRHSGGRDALQGTPTPPPLDDLALDDGSRAARTPAQLEAAHARLTVEFGALQRKHDRLVDQCLSHAGVTHEPIRDLPPATRDPLMSGMAAVFRNLGQQTAQPPTGSDWRTP